LEEVVTFDDFMSMRQRQDVDQLPDPDGWVADILNAAEPTFLLGEVRRLVDDQFVSLCPDWRRNGWSVLRSDGSELRGKDGIAFGTGPTELTALRDAVARLKGEK
jgi:hypothetical protein